MSRGALSPCGNPACRTLTRERLCRRCQAAADQRAASAERERGSAASRGYDADWRKRRVEILERDPVCKLCRAAASTEVDHKVRRRLFEDGLVTGDPEADENLQGLCGTCHKSKTAAEDGGFGNARRVA